MDGHPKKMMKFILIGLAVGLVGAGDNTAFAKANNLGIAYFEDFTMEPLAPYHEKDMETVGCVWNVKGDAFEYLFSHGRVTSSQNYMAYNIAAEVQFHGKTYYIDRNGIARFGKIFRLIDKQQFGKIISLNGRCPK